MGHMRTIASIVIVCIILFTSSSSSAGDDYVNYARSLQAKDYDQSLPALPIDQWLKAILPKNTSAVWGDTVTDCGEQTGNPAIDKERDIPLCAEVVLKQKEKEVGYLMFFVGTEKKGKLKEHALYFGNFKQDDKTVWIKKLSELTKFKRQ
jgi:hypothetical protein